MTVGDGIKYAVDAVIMLIAIAYFLGAFDKD